MDAVYLKEVVTELRLLGEKFDHGLTDTEIQDIENCFQFRFPTDLRTFLQFALPTSKSWVNWRTHSIESIRKRFAWPSEGICFDVEHNNFWVESWGRRPTDLSESLIVAKQHIAEAPILIPLYSHRYIPGEPLEAGNPIFSVYQTDIIYYGYDLASYVTAEFSIAKPNWAKNAPRPIRFWNELIVGTGSSI